MNDASKLQWGRVSTRPALPEGTFVDDVIVHRLGSNDYLLVINAGTREKDVGWVVDNTRQFDCVVEHLSDAYTQIAIQGPKGGDAAEAGRCRPLGGEVLLVHPRDCVRPARYHDRPHRLHRRRWLRNLCLR